MKIRPARQSDEGALLRWRNDQLARSMFLDSESVPREDHSVWFKASLKNPLRKIYIGVNVLGQKVGVCRFDLNFEHTLTDISLLINPRFRDLGLARPLLELAIERYLKAHNVTLRARIKPENERSQSVFIGVGFQFAETAPDGTLLFLYGKGV